MPRPAAPLLALLLASALPLTAQVHTPGMAHAPGMQHTAPAVPKEPGQSAFAAIAEIVALLDADPNTDWSKVNIEALRQHLRDMDEVVLRSDVAAKPLSTGIELTATGPGRVAEAIGRMLPAHAEQLQTMPKYIARTEAVPGGIRLTVTVRDARDTKAISRIQALGLAGLLAEGAHHQVHHLEMARGGAGHH